MKTASQKQRTSPNFFHCILNYFNCNNAKTDTEESFIDETSKPTQIKHPKIKKITEKVLKSEADESDYNEILTNSENFSDKNTQQQEFINSFKLCYACKKDQNIIELDCHHTICDACLSTLLNLQFSTKDPQVLKCHCKKPIKSKIFQTIVSEKILLSYLKSLNGLRLKQKNLSECVICGLVHDYSKTCAEVYEELKNPKTCSICFKAEDYLLSCEHSYCSSCLIKAIRASLEADPLADVFCTVCTYELVTVPKWMIHSVLGGEAKFLQIKNSYVEDVILSPKLECQLCKETFSMNSFTTLDCDHRFCKTCIALYIEGKINNFKVNEIICPACSTEISAHTIQGVVSPSVYTVFLEICIKNYKPKGAQTEKINWCECGFGFVSAAVSGDSCPNCGKTRERKSETLETRLHYYHVKEDESIQKVEVVVCPKCRNGGFRDRGSNFVQCRWTGCGIYFCALCKDELRVRVM